MVYHQDENHQTLHKHCCTYSFVADKENFLLLKTKKRTKCLTETKTTLNPFDPKCAVLKRQYLFNEMLSIVCMKITFDQPADLRGRTQKN